MWNSNNLSSIHLLSYRSVKLSKRVKLSKTGGVFFLLQNMIAETIRTDIMSPGMINNPLKNTTNNTGLPAGYNLLKTVKCTRPDE